MTTATNTLREITRQADYKDVARENRRLRAALGNLIDLCDDWYYGPLFETACLYDGQEPTKLRRAKGVLAGDLRRSVWVKRWVAETIRLRKRARKTPNKIVHGISGLWILALGLASIGVGHGTGWWEPDQGIGAAVAGFGGYMVGGAAMYARVYFRARGIRL